MPNAEQWHLPLLLHLCGLYYRSANDHWEAFSGCLSFKLFSFVLYIFTHLIIIFGEVGGESIVVVFSCNFLEEEDQDVKLWNRKKELQQQLNETLNILKRQNLKSSITFSTINWNVI